MKRIIQITVALSFLIFFCPELTKGQAYRMEIGLGGGSSFYMGDANQNILFKDLRPSVNLLYRYNLNGRFSMKASAGLSGIAGTTIGATEQYPSGEAFRFNRNVLDASAQMEMNFYEFGTPDYVSGSSHITPYVCLGVGLVGLEAKEVVVSPFIPMGIGVKLKVSDRLNIGCEWSFRKTYTDDLDYSDYGGKFQLSDPWLVKSAYDKNKDWYSVLMFNVTVDIFGAGSNCYR